LGHFFTIWIIILEKKCANDLKFCTKISGLTLHQIVYLSGKNIFSTIMSKHLSGVPLKLWFGFAKCLTRRKSKPSGFNLRQGQATVSSHLLPYAGWFQVRDYVYMVLVSYTSKRSKKSHNLYFNKPYIYIHWFLKMFYCCFFFVGFFVVFFYAPRRESI
jgi:hypothetical protein